MWLCAYANETGECYPSRITLSKMVGCSLKTVDRMMVLLIEKGLVKKENRVKDKEKQTNLYTVLIVEGSPTKAVPPPTEAVGVAPQRRIELNPDLTQSTQHGKNEFLQGYPLPLVVVKDEITKEVKPKKITSEVIQVFELFGKGTYERIGIRKQEIDAAVYLLGKFKMEHIRNAVEYVKENRDTERFFSVRSPYDLRIKWVGVKEHKDKANGN